MRIALTFAKKIFFNNYFFKKTRDICNYLLEKENVFVVYFKYKILLKQYTRTLDYNFHKNVLARE